MSRPQHWDDLPAQGASPAVSKRSIVGQHIALARVSIMAGTEVDRHSHPFEQFVQVIQGSGRLTTEEGAFPFRAGTVFHFPPDTWHAATFDEDTVLIETNLAQP